MHRHASAFAFIGSAVAAALLVAMVFGLPRPARSQPVEYPCPANAKSCKVITLTPEEEASLVGSEGLLDHAAWANRVRFGDFVHGWRDKVRNAPAGKVAAPPAAPAPFPPTPPPAPLKK